MEHKGCASPTGRLDWRQRDRAEPEISAAAPKRKPRMAGRAGETTEAGASRNRPPDAHRQLRHRHLSAWKWRQDFGLNGYLICGYLIGIVCTKVLFLKKWAFFKFPKLENFPGFQISGAFFSFAASNLSSN